MDRMSVQVITRRVKMAWIYASSHPQFYRLTAILVLQFTSTVLYYTSLAGGPVEWIKQHLSKLGLELLFSVVTFCVAILLAVGLSSPRLRATTIAGQCAVAIIQFVSDTGDNFFKHGTYNTFIFILLSLIFLSNALFLLFCYTMAKRKDIFWMTLITVTVVTLIVVSWRVSHYREIWGDGLLGKKMDRTTPGMCSFESRGNWPVIDLLPNGIQNFWTGSQTCPVQRFTITANINPAGLLTISCKQGQGKPAYTILPDTRNFTTAQKKQKHLPLEVAKLSIKHEYREPVQLHPTQEVVLVHCGDVTELRTHTQVAQRLINTDSAQKSTSTDTSDGATNLDGKKKKPLNVLVLFFDAVARRQLFRKLPKTMRMLSSFHSPTANPDGTPLKDYSNSEGLRLFQFFRYHVVGFNTDHNTRAMYTGNRNVESARHTVAEDLYQQNFEESVTRPSPRYMVARAETNCEDWAAEYEDRAASMTSLDHELIAPMCDKSYFSHDGHPFGNFRGPYSILRRCLFGSYVHAHTFAYLRGLERRYRESAPNVPWFVIGSFIEGHEGTGEVLSTIDEDLSNYLLQLAADGTLKNTALFLVSDHGLHMGLNFVYSMNGVIEHANPALMLLMPERALSKDLIETLEHNEQALLTAYNIHHTWRDMFSLRNVNRSLSFLSTKLPLNATCKSADILPEYCQCKRTRRKW